MSAYPILDQDDLKSLQREGTVLRRQGLMKIHKRRLNSNSEEEYSNIPLPSPPQSSPEPENEDNYITIPDHLISRETLIFLGFNENAADTIWSRWVDGWDNDKGREIEGGPVTFESMARGFIHGGARDAYDDDDYSWRVAMDSCGISLDLQEAMMTPCCKNVRLTESCKFWLLETVSARYASLRQIQAASCERAQFARRAESRTGESQQPAVPPGQPMPTRFRSTSEMFYGGPRMSPQTTMAPEVRANTPGYTVLFRGGHETSIKGIFNDEGRVENMAGIQSRKGGDFNSTKMAVYLALDFEIANQYAHWAKRRDPSQLAVVLRLEIPSVALESLDEPQKHFAYWPSPGWKSLVWTCRREIRLQNEFSKFARATLVIGTICAKPNAVIKNLPTPEDITHAMALQSSRGDAIQYVFIDDQGLEFLETHASSNCKIHPMTLRVVEEIESEGN